MKISEAVICWTPDRTDFASGMRGKARIFPASTGVDEMAPFARRAGRSDARAHDARLEVRQAYCLMIAFAMSERDGLDPVGVHQLMLGIEEYAAGCAPELLPDEPALARIRLLISTKAPAEILQIRNDLAENLASLESGLSAVTAANAGQAGVLAAQEQLRQRRLEVSYLSSIVEN